MDNLINISSKTLESNGFAVSRSGATSGTRFGDMSNDESGALKSPTLLIRPTLASSIVRAMEALCDRANPATGQMVVEDVRAWLDLAELHDSLI